jgi:hypothetical protein
MKKSTDHLEKPKRKKENIKGRKYIQFIMWPLLQVV